MNTESRLQNLRGVLQAQKCDGLVVGNAYNVRYLTGFTGTAGMCLVTAEQAWFITDFRYQEQAAQQTSGWEIVIAEKGLWKEVARLAKKYRLAKLGFEAEHTSVAALEDAQELLAAKATASKAVTIEAVSTRRAVEDTRLVKDDEELVKIQRAVDVIDEVFEYICGFLKPGLRECEVSDELLFQMRKRGASGPSFTPIVASGVRGALPHGIASDKVIEADEMVTIDMGAIVDGYCSDCTRTVCIGKAGRMQQKIYETVWRAQTEAAAALKPGLSCKAADAVARKIITDAGYGDAFGHGLGHGVGLEIHEAPRLSRLGKGKLAVGNVVTCEPGIYLTDWGGVRIEDMMVITPHGSRVFTQCAKPRKILVL